MRIKEQVEEELKRKLETDLQKIQYEINRNKREINRLSQAQRFLKNERKGLGDLIHHLNLKRQ